jgi:hypothetical protein
MPISNLAATIHSIVKLVKTATNNRNGAPVQEKIGDPIGDSRSENMRHTARGLLAADTLDSLLDDIGWGAVIGSSKNHRSGVRHVRSGTNILTKMNASATKYATKAIAPAIKITAP